MSEKQQTPIFLEIHYNNQHVRTERFQQSVVKIGRHPQSHLRLDYPSVSRVHAYIEVVDGRAVIFDLGAGTGTYVNGSKVHKHTLAPGDRVHIGDALLVYTTRNESPDEAEWARLAKVIDDFAYTNSVENCMEEVNAFVGRIIRERDALKTGEPPVEVSQAVPGELDLLMAERNMLRKLPDDMSANAVHVDEWLDTPGLSTNPGEAAARMVCDVCRMPAWKSMEYHPFLPSVTCTYLGDGKRYWLTGASRLGEVYLSRTCRRPMQGFDLRVLVTACTDWEVSPCP